MDFLRRLAPLSEGDPTRAVAVLRSRFSEEGPLRGTPSRDLLERPFDDSALSDAFAAAGTDNPHAPDPVSTNLQPTESSSPSLGRSHTRREPGQNSVRALADASKLEGHAGLPSTIHALQAGDRTRLRSEPDRSGRATETRPASARASVAPDQRLKTGLPLSEAVLAGRKLPSRDDSPVVHVTIGRIDVVASPAPPAAARANPKARAASVTLADYLRRGNGGQR